MKMTQRGMKVLCSYCLHASVPATKKCLQCDVSLCQNHVRVHSKSSDHTLTEVHAPPTTRRCLQHGLDLSMYCCIYRTCLCWKCHGNNVHEGHYHLSLRDAQEAKRERLNKILGELMIKREKMPNQLQQLELAKDLLTQKIGHVISLVDNNDPVAVLQEEESERTDFCDILDSDTKIRELQEKYNQLVWERQMVKIFFIVFIVLMVLLLSSASRR